VPAQAWVIGSLYRAIDLVKPGGWSAAVVNGDARQPGTVQLFALLRERSLPFVVHNCDPITVSSPKCPCRQAGAALQIVQVIEEMLHSGGKANLP
jgi:hypothetical protein